MDPGLLRIYLMIQQFLKQPGHVWWQMSLVLTMAYTFFVRERLLDHNIFFVSKPFACSQATLQ